MGRLVAERGERCIVSDEWYRGADWDADTQEAFELRLRRARPANRQQYLRIKATYLLSGGKEDDGVQLLHRSIELGTWRADTASAWEQLGDVAALRGHTEEAVACYERVLREQPSLNGTSGKVEISLAEVLLATQEQSKVDEAIGYLNAWIKRDGPKLNDARFRWFLALIDASEAVGDHETAARSAKNALDLAARGPQFCRHRDVGIVQADDLTLHRLKRLAG